MAPSAVVDVIVRDVQAARYQPQAQWDPGYAANQGAADKQTRYQSHAGATVSRHSENEFFFGARQQHRVIELVAQTWVDASCSKVISHDLQSSTPKT